jgi:CO dehydrogenase/acetyl-CoA synthase alpha subunit
MILDEIMTEIKRIYLQEYDVVQKYMNELEKLRPYVELAEYLIDMSNDGHLVIGHNPNRVEYLMKLINKIEELDNGNNRKID